MMQDGTSSWFAFMCILLHLLVYTVVPYLSCGHVDWCVFVASLSTIGRSNVGVVSVLLLLYACSGTLIAAYVDACAVLLLTGEL